MSKLRLTFACWNYDRTRALLEGRVQLEGIDLNYLNLPVEETFFRMLRNAEFDIAEMSLSSYVMSLFKPAPPFVAIPVFPSRSFRHSCIYINAASAHSTIFECHPGCVILSGCTRRSNSAADTKPSRKASSFKVVPRACAIDRR